MAAKFLTEEWMAGLTATVNTHEGFSTAIADLELSLQFVVTAADGDVRYYVDFAGGSAAIEGGDHDSPDATITNDYETAVAISKGELNTQMAFMTGKLKVSGDMAKIMMNQAALNKFSEAAKDFDVEY